MSARNVRDRAKALPLIAAVVLLAAGGCEPPEPRYQEGWDVMPPVGLGKSLAFVERASATAFIVNPDGQELRPRLVPVGKSPITASRRMSQDELLVLCRGERGKPGAAPEAPSLWLVPAEPTQAPRSIPLDSRYSQLAQSADGRYAVAYFGKDAGDDVLFNPNQLALIDLGAAGAMARATPRTIRSFGASPLGMVFSPELNLPGGPRRLAVILSSGYVTLLDLYNPTRPEITIPLTLPEDRRTLTPVQLLFETTDKEPSIFVRTDGSNDIVSLRLVALSGAEKVDGGNEWKPVLSQLGAGQGPADMVLFGAAEGPRLLVASPGSRDVHVIDARTSRATRIPLEAPASRILLFEGPSPAEPAKVKPRALLVGSNTGARVLTFLDLDGVEQGKTRNLQTFGLGSEASGVNLLDAKGLTVLTHPGGRGDGGPGLSMVNLHSRTISPITATPFVSVVEALAPADKLWITPAEGAARGAIEGESRIGFVRMPELTVGSVRVDAPVAQVVPLGAGPDGRPRVVLVHSHSAGHITVLDGQKPERETARQFTGFLLQDLLERGVK